MALLLLSLSALAVWSLGRGPSAPGQAMACPTPVEVDGYLVCEPVRAEGRLLAAGDALHEGRLERMPSAWLGALEVQLDLNRASAAELETVRGVGPVLAGRIVEGRPYASVDELERVRGIGPAKGRALAGRVFVDAHRAR